MEVFALLLCLSLTIAVSKGNNCNCSISESLVKSLVQKELKQLLRQDIYHKGRRDIDSLVFTKCPNGFVRHDDSCYIASHDLANWPDALVYCEAYGSHLTFIETEREQNFLTNYIKLFNGSSTDHDYYYWIGGTDAVSETEWIWAKAVTPVKYTHWRPGEPDNNPGHASKHQDCMAIYGSTGLWDDGWCETEHNFICEIELDVDSSQIVG
ncbi:perlucin-like protein [Ruditapes philippinarum]|uniref:perlucin-like protein n=1 Tax=Ruditapes philippinarum TaxID=129788 RepID=UPI00295A60D2|nr:perlucin-like protein [Ruditapes philippinarum]